MVNFQTVEIAGFAPAIGGMRHPLKSYDRADSHIDENGALVIGKEDYMLAKRLVQADGSEHAKFLRQVEVWVNITAPRSWWQEYATYKIGTVENSQSTMHRLLKDGISREEVYYNWDMNEDIDRAMINQINAVNSLIDYYNIEPNEKLFENIKSLLPEGYLQTRMCSLNYEVLRNMYKQRKNHRLSGWSTDFVDWIHTLPMFEWITGEFLTEEELEATWQPVEKPAEENVEISAEENEVDNEENI